MRFFHAIDGVEIFMKFCMRAFIHIFPMYFNDFALLRVCDMLRHDRFYIIVVMPTYCFNMLLSRK